MVAEIGTILCCLAEGWYVEFVRIGTAQSKDYLYFAFRVDLLPPAVILDLSHAYHWLPPPPRFSTNFPCSLQKGDRSGRGSLLGFEVSLSIDR